MLASIVNKYFCLSVLSKGSVSRRTLRWCGRHRGYRRVFKAVCRRTTSPLCGSILGRDAAKALFVDIQELNDCVSTTFPIA